MKTSKEASSTHLKYTSILLLLLFLLVNITNSTDTLNITTTQNDLDVRIINPIIRRVLGKCQVINGPNNLINSSSVLKCQDIKELDQIFSKMTNSIKTVEVIRSSIKTLNFTLFTKFPNLEEISVTNSQVSIILGTLPVNIKTLNLSSNNFLNNSIPNSVFLLNQSQLEIELLETQSANYTTTSSSIITFASEEEDPQDIRKNKLKTIDTTRRILKVETIDLSRNKITQLPQSIFRLPRLKSLLLAGNCLNGEFVWNKMYEWANISTLLDADDACCIIKEKNSHRSYTYSMLGVLKAKTDLVKVCSKVNKSKCDSCALIALQKDLAAGYPISHKGKHGSISLALTLSCSNRNLVELPSIPRQTWSLDVSNNRITDLSPLRNPIYENLVYVNLENNTIDILTLAGAPLLETYINLNLRNNQISTIPMQILYAMKSVQDRESRGKGATSLGGNYLDCDCDTVKEIQPFLVKHSNKIIDIKEIYCKDLYSTEHKGLNKALIDLTLIEVCDFPRVSDTDHELWIYMVIGLEAFLIFTIVAKVWYDQRRFRETGVLPWCSKKMPRLPCDTILEGFKEPWKMNRSSTTTNQNGLVKKSSSSKPKSSSNLFAFNKTSRSGSDSSGQSAQQSSSFVEEGDKSSFTHGTSKDKSNTSWV